MVRKGDIEKMRKKRDIARAYEDKEGSIAAMARRFHASSRTVQEAIKHDAAWWQARIAGLETGTAIPSQASGPTPPCQHQVLGLVHLNGKDGKPGYQVKAASGTTVMVEGTIDDVLDALSADGWEIVQLVPRGGGDWSDVVVRRATVKGH
jgi:hypothetical protein